MPLSVTERLPEVTPSLGLASVEAAFTSTRDSETSSSSAAICANAVKMPWPISTLPGRIVTRPALLNSSHCESRRLPFKLPGSCLPEAAGAKVVSLSVIADYEFWRRREERRERCGCARHSGKDCHSAPHERCLHQDRAWWPAVPPH